MKKNGFVGVVMLILTTVIWGFAFVAQSRVSGTIGEFTLQCSRSVIAAAFLLPCIILFDLRGERRLFDVKRRRIDITKKELLGGIACGVILAAASVFQQMGIADTGAGVAGFLTSLYVVLVPVLGMAMGKRTTLKNWLCILLALGGTFLISYSGGGFSKGDIFVIICALIFALHILTIDSVSGGCDGIRISFVQFVTGAVVTLPIMLILERPSISSVVLAALPILYLGIMSSGVAYTLQILGQARVSPAVASIIMSLESVFALLGGWWLDGEVVGKRKLVGCIIVFASVIITQINFASLFAKNKGEIQTE